MHFLIVKTSSLGDILHAFSVISYLRQKFPNSTIDWAVEKGNAPLLTSHPEIDNVFLIDTKSWRKEIKNWGGIRNFYNEVRKKTYDAVFDLQGNTKSGLILSVVKAKKKIGFGKKSVAEWPNLLFTNFKSKPPKGLNIREDNLYVVQNFFSDPLKYEDKKLILNITHEEQKTLEELKKGPKILVCPGSFWKNKRLSKEQLLPFLKGPYYVAWGNEKELSFAKELGGVILPKLSLPLLQNLMNEMDLVIAMDSLPLHLAATTKTKTLSFFGPSLGKKFAPIGHDYYQGQCPYNITFEKRCPKLRTCKTGACMNLITENEINKGLGIEAHQGSAD